MKSIERELKNHESILKDIEEKYAQAVGDDESDDILYIITQNTIINGHYIGLPDNSSAYEQEELERYQTSEGLRNRVDQIFSLDVMRPEMLYLLSEEESISDWGLTKLSYNDALDNVLPYIQQWGQPANFWLTDGKRVITFHRNGTMYWNKDTENIH
jgi:hypothetical protein